jgi:hypothetical protein
VPARTSSSKQLARTAPRSALIQFCFHFDICLRATLDMARPHHYGAMGGFFSAPQERAAPTSFEGGDKSGDRRRIVSHMDGIMGNDRRARIVPSLGSSVLSLKRERASPRKWYGKKHVESAQSFPRRPCVRARHHDHGRVIRQ